MDISAIVSSAVGEAKEAAGGTFENTPSDDGSTIETPVDDGGDAVEDAPVVEEKKEVVAKPAEKKKPAPAEDDDLDPEIQDLVKREAKERRGQEPRVPLSMHKRIFGKHRTEAQTYKKQVEDMTSQMTTIKERAALADKWDALLLDPDATVAELARILPDKWGRFKGGSPKPQEAAPQDSDFPEPDVKGADGSIGYSPEGFKKFLSWVQGSETRAAARAKTAAQEELKPIREKEAASELRVQTDRETTKKLEWATKTWGDLFTDDFKKGANSEVLKYARTNRVSWEQALQDVLLPLRDATHQKALDKKREDLLKEMRGRSAAADNSAPGSDKPEVDTSKPRSTRDIVAAEVAKARRSGRV